MSDKSDRSAWWLALAGIVGVIAGALVTGAFNYLDHQRDLDAKMIELSVGILRAAPTSETIPLREWAVDVIQTRAKFRFNDAQRTALLKQELPYKGDDSGSYDDGLPNVLKRSDILKNLNLLQKPAPPQ
jgi:hypothetical protein